MNFPEYVKILGNWRKGKNAPLQTCIKTYKQKKCGMLLCSKRYNEHSKMHDYYYAILILKIPENINKMEKKIFTFSDQAVSYFTSVKTVFQCVYVIEASSLPL